MTLLDNLRQNGLVGELLPDRLHEVRQQEVVSGVLGEAEQLQAELLVVVARRHSLLGSLFHRSVTAQLVQQSPVPLLLLPAKD